MTSERSCCNTVNSGFPHCRSLPVVSDAPREAAVCPAVGGYARARRRGSWPPGREALGGYQRRPDYRSLLGGSQ